MINTIYVKGYLMPDKKRDSKRKTEEVKVESSEAHHLHRKMNKRGLQHVFSPCTFKFSKPLEYTNINKSTIEGKSVQVEVCITQKYSKRSFLIGMFYMPLKVAVKKLVKEKYPLIPCMNHTIPTNMKVYSASELKITSSAKIFYSNPNIRSMSMSTMSDPSERAASEIDMKGELFQGETTSVFMEEEDCCVELGTERDSLPVLPGAMETEDSQVFQVETRVHNSEKNCQKTILDDKENTSILEKHRILPTSVTVFKKIKKVKKKMLSSKDKVSININDHKPVSPAIENWKYQDIKPKSPEITVVSMEMQNKPPSRSSTPTWDFYDIENPFTEDSACALSQDTFTCIPMETKMEVHQKGKNSFYNTNKTTDTGTNFSDTLKHHPGKAVPKIVVTSPVKDISIDIHEPLPKRISVSRDSEIACAKSTLSTPIPPRRKKKKVNLTPRPIRAVDSIELTSLASCSVSVEVENTCPDLLPSTLQDIPHSHQGSDICVIDLTDEEVTQTKNDDITPSVTVDFDEKQISYKNKFTVPTQVFIEDLTSSDSCDEIVENFDKINPFLIQGPEESTR